MNKQLALKRFFARMLDLWLLYIIVHAVFIRFLRYNPLEETVSSILFSYVVYLLMLAAEPCFLALTGTTPGKCIFGLYPFGSQKPSWKQAADRTFGMFIFGMGAGIPLFMWWRMFREYGKSPGNRWQGTEPYECRGGQKRYFVFVMALLVCFGIDTLVSRIAVLPANRGDLSVAEFAENVNDYNKLYGLAEGCGMDSNGHWQEFYGDQSPDQAVPEAPAPDQAISEVPVIELMTENDTVEGFTVHMDLTTKEDIASANMSVVFLLTYSYLNARMGLFAPTEYKEALQLLTSDTLPEFQTTCLGCNISCTTTLENGSYSSALDLLQREDEDNSMHYVLNYEVSKL